MAEILGLGYDPSQYTEHQAVNTSLSSTTLTTLISVTGQGMLEAALITATTTTTTAPEIVITVDGTVILDLVQPTGAEGSSAMGIVFSPNLKYSSSSSDYISGMENLFGGSITVSNLQVVAFPNASQVTLGSTGYSGIVAIDQPIYFKQSLLIQVKGVSGLKAYAKVRY
jgi:hypothetical protein